MKPYVKPALTAFSLTGNETLCSGCAGKDIILKDLGWDFLDPSLQALDTNGDKNLSDSELIHAFSATESCADVVNACIYCKFTSAITALWS